MINAGQNKMSYLEHVEVQLGDPTEKTNSGGGDSDGVRRQGWRRRCGAPRGSALVK